MIQWLKFLHIQVGSFLILTCRSADLVKSFNGLPQYLHASGKNFPLFTIFLIHHSETLSYLMTHNPCCWESLIKKQKKTQTHTVPNFYFNLHKVTIIIKTAILCGLTKYLLQHILETESKYHCICINVAALN